MDEREDLSIEELAERVAVPVRTVRYYVAEGLLPGPAGRGKAAQYGEEHLVRLRLIRRLSERHLPLSEQRERLRGLSLGELRALLAEEEQRGQVLGQTRNAGEYLAALLREARSPYPPEPSPSGPRPAPAPPAPHFQAPAPVPPGSRAAQRSGAHASRSPAPSASAPTPQPPAAPAAAQPAASHSSSADAWRRLELRPGLELHVRADAERREHSLIERLLRLVAQWSR